jgi:hypothetical protein
VAIDVAAEKATELPRDGRARMKERKAASQMVRMGDLNLASTWWKNGCCAKLVHSPHSDWIMAMECQGWECTHNATVSRKRKHHPAVTRHAEQPTMPHANHDQRKHDNGSILAGNVNEDLQHGLAVVAGHSVLKVLDREEEGHEDEEAEQSTEADTADHANRRTPRSLLGLLGEVSGRIEACARY